jgi:hypothetical protein
MMRFAVGVLITVGAGAFALAVADPTGSPPASTAKPAAAAPASAAQTPATAQSAVAPSTAEALPAAAASSPTSLTPGATRPVESAEALLEKRLRAQGYKAYMRNGEKIFCRRETPLGSNLPTMQCTTTKEALTVAKEARDNTERLQRQGHVACVPGSRNANCGN